MLSRLVHNGKYRRLFSLTLLSLPLLSSSLARGLPSTAAATVSRCVCASVYQAMAMHTKKRNNRSTDRKTFGADGKYTGSLAISRNIRDRLGRLLKSCVRMERCVRSARGSSPGAHARIHCGVVYTDTVPVFSVSDIRHEHTNQADA